MQLCASAAVWNTEAVFHSVCVYGDGLLQEEVGGERPKDRPPTHHPITAPLVQKTWRAREGRGMEE